MRIYRYKYIQICEFDHIQTWEFMGFCGKRDGLRLNKTTTKHIQRAACKPRNRFKTKLYHLKSSLILNYLLPACVCVYARKRVFLSPEKWIYIQTMEYKRHESGTNQGQVSTNQEQTENLDHVFNK
jgi:hypothetical protein